MFTKMLEQTLDGTFDNPWYDYGVAAGCAKTATTMR